MSIFSSIGKGIKKALDVNLALFSAPKTLFTKGINSAIAEVNQKSRTQNVVSTLKSGAVAATAVLGAGTTAGKAVISKVIQAVTPKTAGQLVVASVAVPTGIGILKGSQKAREAVVNAPSSLANFGANIGQVIENPTLHNVGQVFSQNPIIAGAVTAGAVGASALALAPVIASVNQTEAIQDQTKAIESNNFNAIPQQIQLIAPPTPAVVAPSGVAPAGISSTKPKKKKKKASKKSKKRKTRRSKKKKKSIKRKRSKK